MAEDFDLTNALASVPIDGFSVAQPAEHAKTNDVEVNDEEEEKFIASKIFEVNRKTKGKKLSGKATNFQSMGLSTTMLRAITKKGFKAPTPIQRKTIPFVLDGRDVVGMARTGSGKTAAFVIPMIEKLKASRAQSGSRAIILSPSRELALQTMKVVKDFSKDTNLRTAVIVGGEGLEEQFSILTNKPDIIVATPGRFLHLKVEMKLELGSIEYVVFDEADRLFEMGFAAQLTEILHGLPSSRQTLLFSATLPKNLVEFAKAGLQEPILVRLDVESKVSSDLQSAFFSVKTAEREAALLYVLQEVIHLRLQEELKPAELPSQAENPKKRKRLLEHTLKKPETAASDSTIVFVPTKHHVEYITEMLKQAGYGVSRIYGSLDQTARKNEITNFRLGVSNVLVVTDVAARGIDIPLLSNVVNYDFPAQPKIFVHRVGRTARAGRTGWAYTFVRAEDAGYLLDLKLFLNRDLVTAEVAASREECDFTKELVLGSLPSEYVSNMQEWYESLISKNVELAQLCKVAAKGEKLYIRTRTASSAESAKRAKELVGSSGWSSINPLLKDKVDDADEARALLLAKVSSFRPSETVFELKQHGHLRTEAAEIMRKRREKFTPRANTMTSKVFATDRKLKKQQEVSESEVEAVFTDSKSLNISNSSKKQKDFRDKEYYMSHYAPAEHVQESGYAVNPGKEENFAAAARSAVLDLTTDEGVDQSRRGGQRWDSKKKKFVNIVNDEDGSRGVPKIIRGESGVKLPATYRSGRFDAWKASHGDAASTETKGTNSSGKRFVHKSVKAPKMPDKYRDDYEVRKKRVKEAKEKGIGVHVKSELRTATEIRKQHELQEKRKAKNARTPRKFRKHR
ncbi:ATP-dependent RNA helicase Dbp10 [Schizosaccharomyces japonicus yFS275]|uniref:RNA helicase n=1 Tax=Schizosaccharomyces japonicus (strain yFS275 / FY16936) TaxID=402676 RepID=B6JWM0_SCHJY|nr:ATP-dependent RNA helicase Dbp10 [Schizosaccharomyces japonicus yFS275]EEB05771.1 ATP-dependent RNA helicase Dbp10 [Schizosaccharomyces japonicus yFS275]